MALTSGKDMDEARQGEVMDLPNGSGTGKKLFLESYGCAMNFADSEIVASILSKEGYSTTHELEEADVVLLNTCSIRENAEQRVLQRLRSFNRLKKANPGMTIGVLGCMAERLKTSLLEKEKLVDLVVGPDAYRDLPALVEQADEGNRSVNVLLSREETYADISPIRLNSNGITAFISIMRGCDNMCSFCVVPFTRGRERSRDAESIVHEAAYLFEQGYREVTLLGQNVDSYRWNLDRKDQVVDKDKESVNFAQLLEKVAQVHPDLRVRFSTSHPKDMTDDVLHAIARYDNICKCVHLPVQSGSSEVLKKMNRGYTREWYFNRIDAIRRIVPEAGITTDIISGFCGETEEQHEETLSLMREVGFDYGYMFSYSERPKTLAERKYEDDVPEEVKKRRLAEVISLQRELSLAANKLHVGKVQRILVEGTSKRSVDDHYGRNSQNVVVVFPKEDTVPGTYVDVRVDSCTGGTLLGTVITQS